MSASALASLRKHLSTRDPARVASDENALDKTCVPGDLPEVSDNLLLAQMLIKDVWEDKSPVATCTRNH